MVVYTVLIQFLILPYFDMTVGDASLSVWGFVLIVACMATTETNRLQTQPRKILIATLVMSVLADAADKIY
jgi:hypothetical protein